MKKEELLNKLRRNVVRQFDMPNKPVDGIVYSDVTNQFVEMSKTVGAKVLEVKSSDDLNSVIRKAYPNAKIFASSINGIEADLNPDTIASAADLNGTDVGIIQGELGVAENGCVWIPQTMKERAVCFISEELVILLDKDNIVSNMHEAYKRIQMPHYGYGVFISGPSKTADIEQALVMGAQAARGVTVILVG
ncbi:MAG: LUD domain-containing protein [Prevotella nigrescens]|uniref:LutC/YkgG family protein n=1 Tax=Prevotella nigrescens TaxID=28133 RepID=UPI001CB56664|nr:LUD domain-containing protein [Prevotella nigrescens]MBF1445100.1 LUD domain-containing protein [Prevotella nigrescens]